MLHEDYKTPNPNYVKRPRLQRTDSVRSYSFDDIAIAWPPPEYMAPPSEFLVPATSTSPLTPASSALHRNPATATSPRNPATATTIAWPRSQNTALPSTSMAGNRNNSTSVFTEGEEIIFRKVCAIQETLKLLKLPMDVADIESDITLPLTALDAVRDLEDKLSGGGFRRAIRLKLSCLGGNTLRKCTANIMCALINVKVASSLNWCGGQEKKSFKAFRQIRQLVFAAVRSNKLYIQSTVEEVKMEVQYFLKHAPARVKYAIKNNERTNDNTGSETDILSDSD